MHRSAGRMALVAMLVLCVIPGSSHGQVVFGVNGGVGLPIGDLTDVR